MLSVNIIPQQLNTIISSFQFSKIILQINLCKTLKCNVDKYHFYFFLLLVTPKNLDLSNECKITELSQQIRMDDVYLLSHSLRGVSCKVWYTIIIVHQLHNK